MIDFHTQPLHANPLYTVTFLEPSTAEKAQVHIRGVLYQNGHPMNLEASMDFIPNKHGIFFKVARFDINWREMSFDF